MADELFHAEGLHVVGIDRILKDAGVAKASLLLQKALGRLPPSSQRANQNLESLIRLQKWR